MTRTFLSPVQADELAAIYEAGAMLVELSKRFDAHRRTAVAHLIHRPVPIHGRGLDERHLPEAVELYVGRLTLLKAGLHFGMSQQTARRAPAAEGVEIRSGGRRQFAVNRSARSAP